MANPEKLALAAKAIGRKPTPYWNPWVCDGDAMELAMHLGMQVAFHGSKVSIPGHPFQTNIEFRNYVANYAVDVGRAM